ncbi:DUF3570 domain-containing protein [Thermochromatium tepidum ATCC 43061]|uniref:DUF3570 domain-containing protein n=1 Tax=Thermochromatium tepidum ATCC 43061 TaxID=316276 RepID=A0A6I6ECI2_THETI|nr:DUF3570 domain-containing protein [Thermochromatium tepidum ATCC 43061]
MVWEEAGVAVTDPQHSVTDAAEDCNTPPPVQRVAGTEPRVCGEVPRTHKTLRALSSAALALPGLASSVQATAAMERQWDLGYFNYVEGGARMRVEGLKQGLVLPLGEALELRVNGVRDTISGASPIYNVPVIRCRDGRVFTAPVISVSGASGNPQSGGPPPERPPLNTGECRLSSAQQVLLEDTFQDVRTAGDFKLDYTRGDTILGLGAGVSQERDYDSRFLALDLRRAFNDKLTTLALGYSLAADTFSPLNRPGFSGDKDAHQFLLGLTQVLSRNDLLQINLTLGDDRGYLSDPYKNVYLLATNTAIEESRPDRRRQWNLLARYNHYFAELKAALHLDYRYSWSDWGIEAQTLEAAWIQPLGQGWQLVPRLRYYTQGEADFYRSYFETLPSSGDYSSDYRLAGFGALSGGLKLTRQLSAQARLDLGVEFYDRQSDYGLQGHTESTFADYGFTLYSLSLHLEF